MADCARCGQEIGTAATCAHCGHTGHSDATDWRTDTAERPRSSVAPPVTATHPEPARFPLYADEATTTTLAAAPPDASPERGPGHRRSGAATGWLPWVLTLAVMLLIGVVGLWLLLGDDGSDVDRAREPSPTGSTDDGEQPSRDDRTPEGRATVSPAPVEEPVNLASLVRVSAPPPSPPTADVDGNPVTFVAAHLLDGLVQTCWRMPGDGTGETIDFRFEGPTEVAEVGLINGYAKTAASPSGALDWYAGNRRTARVEWTFDDGTVVVQDLAETRELQTTTVGEDVVTRRVTLRLLDVTAPGAGPAARNFTALSEVSLRGTPAPTR